jgi:hypothetical protein
VAGFEDFEHLLHGNILKRFDFKNLSEVVLDDSRFFFLFLRTVLGLTGSHFYNVVGSMRVSFSSEHEPKHFFILAVVIVLGVDSASRF